MSGRRWESFWPPGWPRPLPTMPPLSLIADIYLFALWMNMQNWSDLLASVCPCYRGPFMLPRLWLLGGGGCPLRPASRLASLHVSPLSGATRAAADGAEVQIQVWISSLSSQKLKLWMNHQVGRRLRPFQILSFSFAVASDNSSSSGAHLRSSGSSPSIHPAWLSELASPHLAAITCTHAPVWGLICRVKQIQAEPRGPPGKGLRTSARTDAAGAPVLPVAAR